MEDLSARPLILYAEDDFDDFDAVKEALDQVDHHFKIVHAKNGQEVISYLNSEEAVPNLFILDLNMPVMNGKEILEWIKQNPKYYQVPIMVFTTSSREEDIKLCQRHNCTFFRKPTLYRDLLHIAQVMVQMSHANS